MVLAGHGIYNLHMKYVIIVKYSSETEGEKKVFLKFVISILTLVIVELVSNK